MSFSECFYDILYCKCKLTYSVLFDRVEHKMKTSITTCCSVLTMMVKKSCDGQVRSSGLNLTYLQSQMY